MKAERYIDTRALRDRERDILEASAQWDEITFDKNGEFRIGCIIAGERVEGIVIPYDFGVDVKMTRPYSSSLHYYHVTSFFNQRPRVRMLDPDTHAVTTRCIEKAREMIIKLYSDIVWLRMRSDHIREQYDRYLQDWRARESAEKVRVAEEKDIVKELSAKSGELKKAYKSGLLAQPDYISRKKPIHDEIVRHLLNAVVRDPFRDYFKEEYTGCFYLSNLKEVLPMIVRGGTDAG